MAPLLSSQEQIETLLTGKAFSLVWSLFGRKQLSGKEYGEVFTVSRQEVLDHVRQHGFPKGSYCDQPRSAEGPYMLEENGVYVIYYQERGVRAGEARYTDSASMQAAMVDLLLGLSGTGLYGRT